MSAALRQPIVSTFSQGNIVPALIITAVAVLFYYDGLQVYIHGHIWNDFYGNESARSSFYIGVAKGMPMMRPVQCAIEDLIRVVFGLDNPLPFQAMVLGLHTANSILVFLILKKVVDNRVGLFGALLFTSFFAHPEAITYPAGIGEPLRAFFLLSWMILFYKYRENPTKTNYVLTLGAFILALGSKESTALILPPLMYLVDKYIQMESKNRSGGKPNKNFYIPYIPFIMISITWIFLVLPLIAKWTGSVADAGFLGYLINWTHLPINFWLSTITSSNLCFLKGPGYGTLILVLSLMLSCLPIFDKELRKRIILLWGGWLITIIPLIQAGMNLRYLYITSAFSMAILATCVYHLIVYVAGKFRLKETYITLLIILAVSVPISTNFFYVSRHIEFLKTSGRVSESLWKLIKADFPAGTLGTKLVFINLPYIYEPPPGSGYIGARHPLWEHLPAMFAAVYGERNVGPTYHFTLPELYNGRHSLVGAPEISPLELERLAVEKDTRVYIFNPGNDSVLDVTGRDYNSLGELMSNKGED